MHARLHTMAHTWTSKDNLCGLGLFFLRVGWDSRVGTSGLAAGFPMSSQPQTTNARLLCVTERERVLHLGGGGGVFVFKNVVAGPYLGH